MGSVVPPPIPPRPPNGPPGGPGGPVLGPIPIAGMPDTPPFRLDHLEEMATRNGTGEVVFLVRGRGTLDEPIRLIVAANPWSGSITRAAVWLRPGAGYVAIDPASVPGNVADVCTTLALEAGAAEAKKRGLPPNSA